MLSNLVGALGRAAAIRCGHVDLHADKTKTGRGRPQQRARGASSAWLDSPAGSELLAATSAAVTQLARHTPSMTTAELAAATTALATHAPHAAALPAPAVAVLQRACAAVLSAGELSLLDLAAVATAAARLQWSYPGLVDNLAAAAHARAPVLTSLRGVLPQLVAALAALAPTRHPRVWASLAGVYAAKLARAESFYPSAASAANLPVFDAEERQTVLAAFAAVARVQSAFGWLAAGQGWAGGGGGGGADCQAAMSALRCPPWLRCLLPALLLKGQILPSILLHSLLTAALPAGPGPSPCPRSCSPAAPDSAGCAGYRQACGRHAGNPRHPGSCTGASGGGPAGA